MNRIRLLVFNPVLSVLDYRLPAGLAIEFGSLVIAPLGPRQVLGIVWEPERLPGTEVPVYSNDAVGRTYFLEAEVAF